MWKWSSYNFFASDQDKRDWAEILRGWRGRLRHETRSCGLEQTAGWQPNISLKSYNLIFSHHVELSFSFVFPFFLNSKLQFTGYWTCRPWNVFQELHRSCKEVNQGLMNFHVFSVQWSLVLWSRYMEPCLFLGSYVILRLVVLKTPPLSESRQSNSQVNI